MDDEDLIEIIADVLFARLKLAADNFYDANYQPRPRCLGRLSYQPVDVSVRAYIDPQYRAAATDFLSSLNIVKCARYREGGSAYILVGETGGGKKCALRIPFEFEGKMHDRVSHAGVMQPLFGSINYLAGTKIEALPLMPFARTDDATLPENTLSLLQVIFEKGALQSRGEGMFKDGVAVLPDGTPLLADPDNCQFRPGADVFRALNKVDMEYFLRDHPYLQRLSWWQGPQSKQRIFFNREYLLAPLLPVDSRQVEAAAQNLQP